MDNRLIKVAFSAGKLDSKSYRPYRRRLLISLQSSIAASCKCVGRFFSVFCGRDTFFWSLDIFWVGIFFWGCSIVPAKCPKKILNLKETLEFRFKNAHDNKRKS